MQKPITIFISGISGFIASNLVTALIRAGHNVQGNTRTDYPQPPTGLTVLNGDFYDATVLNQLKNYPVDAIIHAAAIRGETGLPVSEYEKVNVKGTEILLNYASENQVRNFLFISTVGVMGTIPHPQPASLNNTPDPDNIYHSSKWEAEKLVQSYHSDNLKTLILRSTITYGPGDSGFMIKMNQLIKKKRFIFPRKDVKIHLLNVNALTILIRKVVEEGIFNGRTYIVADREPVSLKQIADKLSIAIHGRTYPGYYRVPSVIFTLAKAIMRITGNRRMLTSLRLISESWTYDITDTVQKLKYQPKDTLGSIANSVEAG